MLGIWKYYLSILVLITVTIWLAVLTYPEPRLQLVVCDVGQGDAILAIHGKTQILVDGGPDASVLDCLSSNMPFWDRTLEGVVLTHPQKDHYGGLVDVFKRFKVDAFIVTQLDSSSQDFKVLKNLVRGSNARVVNPTTGMVIRFDLIYLDILYPSHQFFEEIGAGLTPSSDNGTLGAFTTNKDPNEFSIVAILRYKDFDALLTGDINPKISDSIAETLKQRGFQGLEYIKIPHHGSKNGISKELLVVSDPKIAVISSGKNNSYGHPHKEVIDLLTGQGIKILRTDEVGDVEVVTDGEKIWTVN